MCMKYVTEGATKIAVIKMVHLPTHTLRDSYELQDVIYIAKWILSFRTVAKTCNLRILTFIKVR